jgi:hypothetical protein
MKKIKAYINGMIEFKNSFTTHYNDYSLLLKYDMGRELMHKITFRFYEQ